MKLKKIWKIYKSHIEPFGFLEGNRVFFARAIKRIRHSKNEKTVFAVKVPRLGKDKLYLRENTTGFQLCGVLLREGGEYDFLFDAPYRKILEKAKVIVDAGANIGIFSRICRSANKSTKIVCIEPEAGNYSNLCRNMNGENEICYNNGLWNKETYLSIVPSSRGTGEVGFMVKEVSEQTEIYGLSIVSLMEKENLDYIDILKIDIEGSEYEVFDETAEQWIEHVGCLIIELHDRIHAGASERVLQKMAEHNFTYQIYAENYVFKRKSL